MLHNRRTMLICARWLSVSACVLVIRL